MREEPVCESSEEREVVSGGRPSQTVEIGRVDGAVFATVHDAVAAEEPLEIRILFGGGDRNGRSLSVTMRTPGNDEELAVGFLLTEGVVQDAADIVAVRPVAGKREVEAEDVFSGSSAANTVLVELAEGVSVHPSTLERNFYMSSSCGICGKGSLLALRAVCPPRRANRLTVAVDVLHGLPAKLRAAQQTFASTGGLHGVGLFSREGELLMLREDVGRHNALDKLLGAQFLADQTPLRDHLLLLSGRASFELLQKAVMGGIGLVAAVGAPSSLAVRLARDFDVTLVGFLRDGRFNIYHGARRIIGLVQEADSGNVVREENA